MTPETEREKLFQLIFWIDNVTLKLGFLVPEEEYFEIRPQHYDNIRWLGEHGLTDEYYDFWYEQTFSEQRGTMPKKQKAVSELPEEAP